MTTIGNAYGPVEIPDLSSSFKFGEKEYDCECPILWSTKSKRLLIHTAGSAGIGFFNVQGKGFLASSIKSPNCLCRTIAWGNKFDYGEAIRSYDVGPDGRYYYNIMIGNSLDLTPYKHAGKKGKNLRIWRLSYFNLTFQRYFSELEQKAYWTYKIYNSGLNNLSGPISEDGDLLELPNSIALPDSITGIFWILQEGNLTMDYAGEPYISATGVDRVQIEVPAIYENEFIFLDCEVRKWSSEKIRLFDGGPEINAGPWSCVFGTEILRRHVFNRSQTYKYTDFLNDHYRFNGKKINDK